MCLIFGVRQGGVPQEYLLYSKENQRGLAAKGRRRRRFGSVQTGSKVRMEEDVSETNARFCALTHLLTRFDTWKAMAFQGYQNQ